MTRRWSRWITSVACVGPVLLLSFTTTAQAADAGVHADASAGCRGDARLAVRDEERPLMTRTYVLDAPASIPDRPLPVVLSFHGFRGNAENHRAATTWAALGARENVIVVHPDGHEGVRLLGTVGRGWDLGVHDTRDVAFIVALLDDLERERCVDRRRVFATGMSNGAFFANLLGCALADRIAAIAPVAGAMPLAPCTPARPVPVLLVYGRADDVVPPALMRGGRDWWAEAEHCTGSKERDGCRYYEGCRADVVACEGPQAHVWPTGATEQIWRFFRTHPRAD